jgi:hypothetical protein
MWNCSDRVSESSFSSDIASLRLIFAPSGKELRSAPKIVSYSIAMNGVCLNFVSGNLTKIKRVM